jgi:hypothetical protein
MQSSHQFEYEVALDSELDSNSAIPNWIGSPPSRACLLGSPAPYWCFVCPPWSSPWLLRTFKSLGSNRLSILVQVWVVVFSTLSLVTLSVVVGPRNVDNSDLGWRVWNCVWWILTIRGYVQWILESLCLVIIPKSKDWFMEQPLIKIIQPWAYMGTTWHSMW